MFRRTATAVASVVLIYIFIFHVPIWTTEELFQPQRGLATGSRYGCGADPRRNVVAVSELEPGLIAEDLAAALQTLRCLYFVETRRNLADWPERAIDAGRIVLAKGKGSDQFAAGQMLLNYAGGPRAVTRSYSDLGLNDDLAVRLVEQAKGNLLAAARNGEPRAHEQLYLLKLYHRDMLGESESANLIKSRMLDEARSVAASEGDPTAACQLASEEMRAIRYDGRSYEPTDVEHLIARVRKCTSAAGVDTLVSQETDSTLKTFLFWEAHKRKSEERDAN